MAHDRFGDSKRIPEAIRESCLRLCEDVAMLHLKWSYYLELFGSRENTALCSDTARAFFQILEEALRNDIILAICRLSDPSRMLGGDNLSFAAVVAECRDIPRLEDLLMAFQAACGPARRYRNRRLGHNDPDAIIQPHQNPLHDVDRPEIDEMLWLAGALLKAIYGHFSAGDPGLMAVPIGGAGDLIDRLKVARTEEAGSRQELPTGHAGSIGPHQPESSRAG
jgi:hypothetical protein